MEFKDYYAVLGVKREAAAADIKRAYRKLARKYHPDVSTEKNAEAQFKNVQEAYEVLKDPKKREAYDQLGSQWKSGQEFHPPPNTGFDFDGNTVFNQENMGGFSDFFESIFGRAQPSGFGQQRARPARRGQDEHAKIAITFEEAFRGGEKTIHLQIPEIDAAGRIHNQTRTLKIHIPPGVLSGQQLRLTKQGGKSPHGGEPGDLYLEIELLPHRYFSLQGRDVYLTLPIAPWEAALGAKIKVPTLGGAVDLKITAGSQTGQKLRLKGRGFSNPTHSADQYILLQVWTPATKTDADRQLYEKMAEQMPFNPRENLF